MSPSFLVHESTYSDNPLIKKIALGWKAMELKHAMGRIHKVSKQKLDELEGLRDHFLALLRKAHQGKANESQSDDLYDAMKTLAPESSLIAPAVRKRSRSRRKSRSRSPRGKQKRSRSRKGRSRSHRRHHRS